MGLVATLYIVTRGKLHERGYLDHLTASGSPPVIIEGVGITPTAVAQTLDAMQAGAQIISGTPGRVHDLIEKRHLNTKKLQILVIDEVRARECEGASAAAAADKD